MHRSEDGLLRAAIKAAQRETRFEPGSRKSPGTKQESVPERLPALSVRQPWADLIVMGVKDVENRTKRTHLRGTILIHASAARPSADLIDDVTKAARNDGHLKKNEVYEPELGALIGMVDIVNCTTVSDSIWFEGPYGWVLANPRPFEQVVPFKGAVGIFYVPREVLQDSAVRGLTPAVAL